MSWSPVDCVPSASVLPTNAPLACRQADRNRRTKETRRGGAEEQTTCQTCRAVEENVVEDGVLIIKTRACADDGLAGTPRIPSDADLRSEVLARKIDLI